MPHFFFLPLPKAAQNGRPGRPKRGAEDAVLPEGEGNPAEGGSSRVWTNVQRIKSDISIKSFLMKSLQNITYKKINDISYVLKTFGS